MLRPRGGGAVQCDAQTSGGLLIAISPDATADLIHRLAYADLPSPFFPLFAGPYLVECPRPAKYILTVCVVCGVWLVAASSLGVECAGHIGRCTERGTGRIHVHKSEQSARSTTHTS